MNLIRLFFITIASSFLFIQIPEATASYDYDIQSISVYGRHKPDWYEKDFDPNNDQHDLILTKLGGVPITDDNRAFFRGLSLKGQLVLLTDENFKWYSTIIFSKEGHRLVVGKTYNMIPKRRDEEDHQVFSRMAFQQKGLSFVND